MRLFARGAAAVLALLAFAACAGGQQRFSPTPTATSPAGVRATVDLPTSQHMRNVGGSDGAGLCVFTSIQQTAYWQWLKMLDGFREWMRQRPGGGWPGKVDQMLAQFCREKGVAVPEYVQHIGGDDAFLDLAIKTDRLPCVTYDGRDDFYRSQVAHMVNLAHMDASRAAIIDNNRPGTWLWMSRADFLARWRGNGGGWAIVFLAPPPPPYTAAPAASLVTHEWVGSVPASAGFAQGGPCNCGGAKPCECGESCRCGPPVVFGQCANGQCRLPYVPQPLTPAPQPDEPIDPPFLAGQAKAAGSWVPSTGGGYGYWVGNSRVYDLDAAGVVRRCNANGFPVGDPIPAPVDLPGGRPAAAPVTTTGEPIPPGGVVPHRIHDAPAYSLTGRPCTRDEAHIAVGGGSLADDSDRWHLTAVGGPELTAKVRADVAALPEVVRAKLLVQCYPADAWPITQFGLAQGVSLRAPSPFRTAPQLGAVGVAEYAAGTTTLADLLSVAGGPTPSAKPAPAPSPSPTPGPAPSPSPGPPDVPTIPGSALWAMLAAVLVMVFRRR